MYIDGAIISSHGGLEVEQWSDNKTLSILVDQSPLGSYMIIRFHWTRMLCTSWMCVIYLHNDQ